MTGIRYCDRCSRIVSPADISTGDAVQLRHVMLCPECVRSLSPDDLARLDGSSQTAETRIVKPVKPAIRHERQASAQHRPRRDGTSTHTAARRRQPHTVGLALGGVSGGIALVVAVAMISSGEPDTFAGNPSPRDGLPHPPSAAAVINDLPTAASISTPDPGQTPPGATPVDLPPPVRSPDLALSTDNANARDAYAAALDAFEKYLASDQPGKAMKSFDVVKRLYGDTEWYRTEGERLVDAARARARAYGLPVTVFTRGDTWHYHKGSSDPDSRWTEVSFDDSEWLSGPAGIGYGDGDDATILKDMRYNYTTVFMRRIFDVASPSLIRRMQLTVEYDDGFVASINGVEVARMNAPGAPRFDATAHGSHESHRPERKDITSAARSALRPGTNVFTIILLNRNLESSDATMIPTLTMRAAPAD